MVSYTDPSSGWPNVPDWEEDANSPIDVTGTTSVTYTMNQDYDRILVLTGRGYAGFDSLRINGVSASDYRYVNNADVETTGATEIPIPSAAKREYIQITADSGAGSIYVSTKSMSQNTGQTVGAANIRDGPPINDFELFDSGGASQDTFARVYGRNI